MAIFTRIVRDAKNKILALIRVDQTGAPIADDPLGSVLLRLGVNQADPWDGAEGQELRIWNLHFTDLDGVAKVCKALFSAPVDDFTTGPEDAANTPYDLWVGGGGGGSGLQRFRIKQMHEQYYTCRTYGDLVVASATVHAGSAGTNYQVNDLLTVVGGGATVAAKLKVTAINPSTGAITGVSVSTGGLYTSAPPTSNNAVTGGHGSGAGMDLVMGGGEGATDVLVAKPPEIRVPPGGVSSSEVIEGVTWTFTYAARANNADWQRTATATGRLSQIEIVEPIWHVNAASDGYSEIWADQPSGGTGIAVAGEVLTWMDVNRAGRVWVQVA